MAERVLITGGAGFIGSYLCDAYLSAGFAVRVLDNLDAQVHGSRSESRMPPDYLNPEVEFIYGDVRDADVVRHALREVDVVSHHAARVGVGQSMYEIAEYVSANSLGAATLLGEIVNGKFPVRKLIVASSMSAYGEGAYRHQNDLHDRYPPLRGEAQLQRRDWELIGDDGLRLSPVATQEGKPLQPTSVYAITKRDHEELFMSVGRAYGIPAVALRYFNVFGARQALSNPYTGVVAIFSSRLLNGHRPLVFEDGLQLRDFVFAGDIASANVAATVSSAADNQPLNIGQGRPVTILEVARVIAKSLGLQIEPEITGRYRVGDVRHCFGDIRKATTLLGWSPTETLETGAAAVAEWVQTQLAEDHVESMAAELGRRGLTR